MILKFLNKTKEKKNENTFFLELACLLIHTAKIDEKYTDKEKNIIKNSLNLMGADQINIDNLISDAEEKEKNSNQILEFTKKIKNLNNEQKKKIIESLWNIIYSDGDSDMYESNLMTRLSGLLYLDKKVVGDIKEQVKIKFNK
tara:strand:- start:123 stop:551 length:429 start_codon:yes stop_codon:yes gene_type:complete